MASVSSIPYTLKENTRELISKSKVLVIGAGGIGCEVLKNLAMSGFPDIEIVSIIIAKMDVNIDIFVFTTFLLFFPLADGFRYN